MEQSAAIVLQDIARRTGHGERHLADLLNALNALVEQLGREQSNTQNAD